MGIAHLHRDWCYSINAIMCWFSILCVEFWVTSSEILCGCGTRIFVEVLSDFKTAVFVKFLSNFKTAFFVLQCYSKIPRLKSVIVKIKIVVVEP